VYVVEPARFAVGSRVIVAPPAVTAAVTTAPAGPRSSNVDGVTDAGSTASLNSAVTFALAPTAVAPDAGVTLASVGGVVSSASVRWKATSTQ
jgi:hypothetical protein